MKCEDYRRRKGLSKGGAVFSSQYTENTLLERVFVCGVAASFFDEFPVCPVRAARGPRGARGAREMPGFGMRAAARAGSRGIIFDALDSAQGEVKLIKPHPSRRV